MNLLNAGCGTHYAQGWVNTDVWENETTKPDVLVTPGKLYPFPDNHFDAIYLGHVLEHIDWKDLPAFLRDMSRIAKPGAPILVVGPDAHKTIQRWKDGLEPWWLVESVLEHQDINPDNKDHTEWWDGATHHWNCHEERVIRLMNTLGFQNVENVFYEIPDGNTWMDKYDPKIAWPVVSKAPWQLCVRCTNSD